MEEQWLDIKGYENLYQISNLGNVKSLNYYKTSKPQVLKARPSNGYLRVYLVKNKNKKEFYIHRLVAEAFIPNPNKLSEINHKNENKSDNRIDNLEWCSHKYNLNYGKRNSKYSKEIVQYDLEGNIIRNWSSASEASKMLNIDRNAIIANCRKRHKTCGGFIWKYKGVETNG